VSGALSGAVDALSELESFVVALFADELVVLLSWLAAAVVETLLLVVTLGVVVSSSLEDDVLSGLLSPSATATPIAIIAMAIATQMMIRLVDRLFLGFSGVWPVTVF